MTVLNSIVAIGIYRIVLRNCYLSQLVAISNITVMKRKRENVTIPNII